MLTTSVVHLTTSLLLAYVHLMRRLRPPQIAPPPRLRHAPSTAAASESLVSITSIEGLELRQLEATCSCPAGAPGRLGQLGRCRVCGLAWGGGGSAVVSIDESEERGSASDARLPSSSSRLSAPEQQRSVRQHTSAYGSIRQHTAAYGSRWQQTAADGSRWQHMCNSSV